MESIGDRLDERFQRLRYVVRNTEKRIAAMPELVLECFFREDLTAIRLLLEEKKILGERVRLLSTFIEKWENPGFESILGVTKSEDEQRSEIFQ